MINNYSTILVAVDGSKNAELALQHGVAIAKEKMLPYIYYLLLTKMQSVIVLMLIQKYLHKKKKLLKKSY